MFCFVVVLCYQRQLIYITTLSLICQQLFYFYVLFVKCLLLKHLSALKYIRIACLHFSISTVRKSPIQCVSRISLTIITPLSLLVNNLFTFILRDFFAFILRNNLFLLYYDILILYIVLFLITNTIYIYLI